jgi:shikimate dehydrogenase
MPIYGLIGYPLTQSFSQKYFRNKFTTENILNSDYLNFSIQTISEFPTILKNNPTLKGLNVTIPYKQQVLKYVDEFNDVVQHCGATNTLKFENGKIKAFNTDVIGFEQSLFPLLQPHHQNALIFGTGGSSKAVAFVLNKLNINFLYVTRNTPNNAHTINYTAVSESLLQTHTLLINCTPSGMTPNEHTFLPIPYSILTPKHILYDLVYNPSKTIFLQKGEQHGAVIKNGYDMLLLQAEASWKIWNENSL